MNLNVMRLIDRYAGAILISLLCLTKPFKRLGYLITRRQTDPSKAKTIVIQKYFGMGSIANGFPLINRLREHFPGVRIVFITFEANRHFLELTGMADEVITVRPTSLWRFSADCLRAIAKCRRQKVDICFDLEFFSNFSMIMSYMFGAPTRVGFFTYFNRRSALLTHPAPFNHYRHISRVFLAMGEMIGLSVNNGDFEFRLHSRLPVVGGKLKEILEDGAGEQMIVINPNASSLCEMRRWPPENFAKLINRLTAEYPQYRIVLIGAPAERPYVEQVRRLADLPQHKVVNLAGKTDLDMLLGLLEMAFLLISNDSGPVHLASGYHTNTVALFGPETPILYRPRNPNAVVLYNQELYCSPCINVLDNKSFEECRDVKCMSSISVDDVMEKAALFLVGS